MRQPIHCPDCARERGIPIPANCPHVKTATVMFNGSVYTGELLRETPKRIQVRFTTPTGRTRENWFTKTPDPGGRIVSRRVQAHEGDNTLPANSGFVNAR